MSNSKISKRDFNRTVVMTRPEEEPVVRVKPHIEALLGSSYHIAAAEQGRLQAKILGGEGLDYNEMRKFKMLNEIIMSLAKEERAQDAAFDASKLTNEDLLANLDKAKKILAGDGE